MAILRLKKSLVKRLFYTKLISRSSSLRCVSETRRASVGIASGTFSGHSMSTSVPASARISRQPRRSSSALDSRRYASMCTKRAYCPELTEYSFIITNVGEITLSVTPSLRAIACVSVVFPAPRSPESAMTVAPARPGSAASTSPATSSMASRAKVFCIPSQILAQPASVKEAGCACSRFWTL